MASVITMTILPVLVVLGIGFCSGHETRPHIIAILVDDLGYDDVSFHGSNQIPTPNIDALAYDGIILNNYYTNRICTPSRAALMTGRHPTQLGLQHRVIASSQPYGLGLNETIFPEYVKKLGYCTHMVGKWHLGYYAEEFTPTFRGFDSFFGYYSGMEDYFDHTYRVDDTIWGLDLRNNTAPVFDEFGEYSTDLFTREAVNVINRHDSSQPLFLYLPYQGVHTGNGFEAPYLEAPWKYVNRFPHIKTDGRRTYAGMLAAVDDGLGEVARALFAKGMLNDSIIFLSSDNGGQITSPGGAQSSNWPLRGLKYTLWEGGNKGSAFMWSPRFAKSGYASEHMMQIEDVLPTLLHAAGYDTASLPGDLYGKDMWHALSHNLPGPRHEMLHNTDRLTGELAMRSGDMKVITSSTDAYTAKLDGWYYPSQVDHGSDVDTRRKPEKGHYVLEPYTVEHLQSFNETVLSQYKNADYSDLYTYERESSVSSNLFESDLSKILLSMGRPRRSKNPVPVKCGKRPANGTHQCQVGIQPCLFNITADPCEYTNLAGSRPSQLQMLLKKVKHYEEAAAPPKNKPQAEEGLPQYHNGVWDPWVKLTEDQLISMRRGKYQP